MQLSFALYAAANRMARLHKPILDPLGLTFPQYLVLLELFAGAPRTVGEIGAKVDMDAGTITPLLKRLESAGKVTRKRDSADERRVLVDLTPAGEAQRDAVLAVTEQIKTACQMTEQDLLTLSKTLDGLTRPAPKTKA
jgi:DNA-binding MarR family transcriptional regulator